MDKVTGTDIAIHPYKLEERWVFDDDWVGLDKELFIRGADAIIDRLAGSIPNAEQGFTLRFSAFAFPEYQTELECRRKDDGGNWYYSSDLDMEGWLCPQLYKYFKEAPKKLYIACGP